MTTLSAPLRSFFQRSTAVFAVISLCFLAACASPVVTKPSPLNELTNSSAISGLRHYRIDSGDMIEIKFFFVPELNDLVQVRPDGKISVMFAGDIEAAGKSPEELGTEIQTKLAKFIKQGDLVVIVRNSANQKAYVAGEVARPGPVLLTGHSTLFQVLSEAGGITPLGKFNEIALVRSDDTGQEKVYPINFTKIISGEDMTQNVLILAGDQIFVPPSDVTSFDRWVDQYIRQALPFSTSAGVSYTNTYQTER